MRITSSILLFLCLVLIFNQQPALSQGSESIRVMTYNIWNGFDWGKDLDRKERLITWVRSKDLDIMALQELCGYSEEQLSRDAERWGHPYSILLKTEGYPVGLTSKKPIELIERMVEPLWHGMLHCRTYDLDVFVVHLSPSDLPTRRVEAQIITKKIGEVKKEGRPYMVMGDFNAHSPYDANRDARSQAILQRYMDGDLKNEKYRNLENGRLDYSVISAFLSVPAIDVCQQEFQGANFTFPAPVLMGSYFSSVKEIEAVRKRIDFILADPELANACKSASIFNGVDTGGLSDHFPVMAVFDWPPSGK